MTGNKYLLDTNIFSAFLKGDILVKDKIFLNDEIYIPVIVVGELMFGANLSNKLSKHLDDINQIRNTFYVLPITANTCQHYGTIKAALRRKGRPVPENDIWIAAIAIQHNLILSTRDAHFNEVDNLITERW